MNRRIVCAAIRHPEDLAVICGPRHFDRVMGRLVTADGRMWHDAEQGFVDQRGNFLSRTEAWKVATEAGQIARRCGGDDRNGGTLFSENLY